MDQPLRIIAMWSGPHNISTAMMRAWENRPDCAVSDEPLYAAWLSLSGADHPGREGVMAARERNWRKVVAELTRGPMPDGQAIWYQKHMCHHLDPSIRLDWIAELTNVFLIRRPDEVVASYVRARGTEDITPEDVGLPQQAMLFDWLEKTTGRLPPLIDGGEFLTDPEGHLRALWDWLEPCRTYRRCHNHPVLECRWLGVESANERRSTLERATIIFTSGFQRFLNPFLDTNPQTVKRR